MGRLVSAVVVFFSVISLLTLPLVHAVTITVTPEVIGKSPDKLGYNIAHFMPGSNVDDWWRYSGTNAARVFLSSQMIEPEDDLAPFGDGVSNHLEFMERRNALRANPKNSTLSLPDTAAHLKTPFINWTSIYKRYEKQLSSGNNRFRVKDTFIRLRKLNADILVQITASKSSFPVSGADDWAGLWELWQHYYFQSYYLGKHFDVERYSMFNEPNHRHAKGLTTKDWLLRLRFTSDAIQCAIADVNRDYSKNLVPLIHAPTTAGTIGGAYKDWGKPAIKERHLRIDGAMDPNWNNFHIYSYQYYGMKPSRIKSQANELKKMVGQITPKLPKFAVTEFNVRTGANFDKTPDTMELPESAATLGANCIALADAGIENLYLFKFGMTANTASKTNYPVQKNGVYHVDNRRQGSNNYGGISLAGEAWRLFNRMAGERRDRLKVTDNAPKKTLAHIATHDKPTGATYLYIVNLSAKTRPVTIRADGLNIEDGTEITISEVSKRRYGTIRYLAKAEQGTITPPNVVMHGYSIWLVRIPSLKTTALKTLNLVSDANTQLRDGHHRRISNVPEHTLNVSNGTKSPSNRRVAVIGFDLTSADPAQIDSAVLNLTAQSSKSGSSAQAHVYALAEHEWKEGRTSWSNFEPLLQKVPAGAQIRNNVIIGNGRDILIQGQIRIADAKPEAVYIDVTDYLKKNVGKRVTFLIVQESRWDTEIRGKKPKQIKVGDGDIQDAGLILGSRKSGVPPTLKIFHSKSKLSETLPASDDG